MDFTEALKAYNGGILRGAATRLAKALKVSKPMVTDWSKYGKRPGEEMAAKIGREFKMTAQQVLDLFESKPEAPSGVDMTSVTYDVPLVNVHGLVCADRFSIAFDAPLEELVPNPAPGKKVIVLKITGDCMEPTLRDGEFVYIYPDRLPADKQIVLAQLDGEYTLKRYRVLAGVPWLVPDNKKYDRIKVTSKVLIRGVADGTYRRNL
jgi:SOS-response transcriptional repressor LexA